jgi:hypothetical protein
VKHNQNKFGQANFFRLCDWMKTHREMLERTRPTNGELRALIKEELKLEPADSTIAEAKEVLEMSWEVRRKTPAKDSKVRSARIVARVLRDLMRDLGQPVPEALLKVCGGKPLPDDQEPAKPPQPVPAVPQPPPPEAVVKVAKAMFEPDPVCKLSAVTGKK